MVPPVPPASAEEIREANTRYHDVAAEHYDSKWGIDFGDLGARQVAAVKALGGRHATTATARDRRRDRMLHAVR
jgi:hypothetical protein